MFTLDCDMPDAQTPPPKKSRPYQSNAATQGVQIQRILWQSLKGADHKPAELAALARAWCDVNEERRKLAMRALPKSVDVSKVARRGKGRSAPAPAEPVEPGPVETPKA